MATTPDEDQYVAEKLAEAQKLYEDYSKVVEVTRVAVHSTVTERPQVDTTLYPVGLVVRTT
jgi:hypothetical protein